MKQDEILVDHFANFDLPQIIWHTCWVRPC